MSAALEGATERSSPSIALAVILILFGVLAIASPIYASFGVVRVVSWLVTFDGLVQLIYAFQSKGVGRIIWKVLVALLYLATGLILLTHPLLGLAGFTLMVALFFVAEGLMDLSTYMLTRRGEGSGWLLMHGLLAVILGFMLWRRWPFASLWAIGTLVGISMLLSGVTRLGMAMAIRKAAR
jgi:uncharacterized membrane protein HdeD (DUF308 family)